MKDNELDPNPPYGERGAFRKITITLPQELYERLVKESALARSRRSPTS